MSASAPWEPSCVLAEVVGGVEGGDEIGGLGVDVDLGFVVFGEPAGDVGPVPRGGSSGGLVVGA
jgi:hypothetical protein